MDVGGSHVTTAVVDLAQRELVAGSRQRELVDGQANADVVIGAWAGTALASLAPTGLREVSSIGIAMPGPFAYDAGVSLIRHKFPAMYGMFVPGALRERWCDTPLAAAPIRMANDAALYALGEWWAGAAQGHDSVIGLTLGTGLGSGFIRHGQIVRDAPDVPDHGEIWDLPYQEGIAEDYVNGEAITDDYWEITGLTLTPAEIAQCALEHDEAARTAYMMLGAHLAEILDPLVKQFHPNCIVVGGNIARAWSLFGRQLQGAWSGVECLPSTQFDDATLLGAAALCASPEGAWI
jgi:glucokinase